jgi:hypothetical protein
MWLAEAGISNPVAHSPRGPGYIQPGQWPPRRHAGGKQLACGKGEYHVGKEGTSGG